jgi:hypothetical protein
MEQMTVAAMAAVVVAYVAPAVRSMGARILAGSVERIGDAAVSLGECLARRLVARPDDDTRDGPETAALRRAVSRQIEALADATDAPKVAAQLEATVGDLLEADAGLRASVAALLCAAPPARTDSQCPTTLVGGNNPGVILTGNGNTYVGR